MHKPNHVDTCQRCRLVHRHVHAAMRALKRGDGLTVILHLYAGLDYLQLRPGCDRAWQLMQDAAAHAKIHLEPRQRGLFKPRRP